MTGRRGGQQQQRAEGNRSNPKVRVHNRSRFLVLLVLATATVVVTESARAGCRPVPGSSNLFAAGRVLLLGELHGTRESPDFVDSVVCNALAAELDVIVGLELSRLTQPRLEAYLVSEGTDQDRRALLDDPMWQRSYQDGRTSRAMLRLLDRLRQRRRAGKPVHVVAFDASGRRGNQQRERDMATSLLRSIEVSPQAMHVVLTGNRHSRVFPGVRGDSGYQPMGYVLEQALGSQRVISLDAGHSGGTAWICSPDCGIARLGGRRDGPPGAMEIADETRPAGHRGWYFVGPITASPPASGAFCRHQLEGLRAALSSDYRSFDQTKGEGWRKLAEVQCQPEAALLIEQYLAQNEGLPANQRRNLRFHAGQVLAFEDERTAAIANFEQALDETEPEDATFKWNAYVRATLAFLRGDRDELARQREIVARSAAGGRAPNLHVVDALLEHVGQSYRVAYAAPASAKSNTEVQSAPPRPGPQPAASASAEQWQGHWQAYEYGAKSWTIRFEGRDFHAVVGPDDWYRGKISLRPDKVPAEVDFLIEECRCSFVGETSEAIFVWDGDALTLAAPRPGSPRPTIFDEDSGQLVRLKRIDE
jgi:hypothetical protein